MRGMTTKNLLLLAFTWIIPTSVHAQSKYHRGSVAFQLGTTQYQGELQNDFFRLRTVNPFNGLSYTHYASPLIDLRGSLMMGSWGYQHDKLNAFDVDVLSMMIEAKIKLRKADDPVWMPYFFGGIGAQHFSNWTLTDYNGVPVVADPKGDLLSASEVDGYQSSASLGFGFQIRCAERVFIGVEERLAFPGLDIADGLVENYPDKMLFHTISIGFGLFNWKDSDGDLISDKHDKCPDTPRSAATDEYGCPFDTDEDGVPDYLDHCMFIPGTMATHGCADTDGDAVADSVDRCPAQSGIAKFYGCPDTDGDDLADIDDQCPSESGSLELNGCPDSDQDGVRNADDLCPDTSPQVRVDSKGCPLDQDQDGVPDHEDVCPDESGSLQNSGCPEVKAEVKELFRRALSGIKFETGKEIIREESFPLLDSVVMAMENNPLYKLKISGHTDNAGDSLKNTALSDRRAKAVKFYLIKHGVDEARIVSATGYGSSRPIADNNTKTGRALNRRVEFEVEY